MDGAPNDSVLTRWTRQLIADARLSRTQHDALLVRVGLTPEALARELPPGVIRAIWEQLTNGASGGTGFRFSESLEPRSLGLLGYIASASATLLEALERVVRYQVLVKPPGSIRLSVGDDEVVIVDGPPPGEPPWPAALAEAVLGSYLAIGQRLSGARLDARRVGFRHRAPTGASALQGYFGCVPRFRAPVDELVLARADLDRPIVSQDPILLRYLEPIARREANAAGSIVERARVQLARSLASEQLPSLESLARTLGSTPRTLQRQLRAEGSGFSSLLDEVRRDYARDLLADRSLTSTEIAYLLGFRDTSALAKALRRLGLRPLVRQA